jgi:mannosyltransferase OCH1-like enzyme
MVKRSRSRKSRQGKEHKTRNRRDRRVRRVRRTARVRKTAIPMKVHQIFYNIGKGELKDIPAFKKCYDHNKEYCKKHCKRSNKEVCYQLWTRKMVEHLFKKHKNKEYEKVYYDFREDIQRIDFARYLVLLRIYGLS